MNQLMLPLAGIPKTSIYIVSPGDLISPKGNWNILKRNQNYFIDYDFRFALEKKKIFVFVKSVVCPNNVYIKVLVPNEEKIANIFLYGYQQTTTQRTNDEIHKVFHVYG